MSCGEDISLGDPAGASSATSVGSSGQGGAEVADCTDQLCGTACVLEGQLGYCDGFGACQLRLALPFKHAATPGAVYHAVHEVSQLMMTVRVKLIALVLACVTPAVVGAVLQSNASTRQELEHAKAYLAQR